MIIRRATLEDVPWIMSQLPLLSDHYGTKHCLMGEHKEVRDKIVTIIIDHVLFVAISGAGYVGFIAGLVTNHFYNQKIKVLTQFLWWVIPSQRRTIVAGKLLDMFTAWGRSNVDMVSLNIMANTPVNIEALERRGFVEKDRNFILEIV